MYAVVEWKDEDHAVSVVPTTWLADVDGVLHSAWPPQRIKNSEKAMKQRTTPDADWPRFAVILRRSEDTYERALQKCKKYENSSSLSTTESELDKSSRHRRCCVELSDAEPDHTQRSRQPKVVSNKKLLLLDASSDLPAVPAALGQSTYSATRVEGVESNGPGGRICQSTDGLLSVSYSSSPHLTPLSDQSYFAAPLALNNVCVDRPGLQLTQDDVFQQEMSRPLNEGLSLCTASTASSQSSQSQHLDRQKAAGRQLFCTPRASSAQDIRAMNGGCLSQSAVAHVEQSTLRVIIQQNAEMKEELKQIKATLNEVLRRQRGAELVKVGKLPDNVNLPLKTLKDVQTLEDQLRSHETYNQVVAHLSLSGGSSSEECTSRVMQRLMLNDLARYHYTWQGRSEKKKAFCTLRLKAVVIDAVRRNPMTSKSSDADIEHRIKLWLRGAADREGGRAERVARALSKKAAKTRHDDRRSSARMPRSRSNSASPATSRSHSEQRSLPAATAATGHDLSSSRSSTDIAE